VQTIRSNDSRNTSSLAQGLWHLIQVGGEGTNARRCPSFM
jgi:hypothetical protein